MSTNLSKAFVEFRRNGYFAKQNFMCCQSCAWSELTAEQGKKAVFYHNQDYQDLKNGDDLYLAWAGDGEFICETLERFGMVVKWDGNSSDRIMVYASSIV